MAIIPQNVAFEQAKQELIGCVNFCIRNLGVRMYEIEIILRDLYNDAFKQAQQEYDENKRVYEEALRAEESAANTQEPSFEPQDITTEEENKEAE